MAIKLENKTNVSAPDATYPYGNIKDNSGANDGTPLSTIVHADFHQFFAKLLDEAEGTTWLTANGLPENDVNGFQYYTSLLMASRTANKALIGYIIESIIGDDFDNTKPYAMKGLADSGAAISIGYVYYSGTLYICGGLAYGAIVNDLQFNQTGENVITITDSAVAGLFQYDDLIFINKKWAAWSPVFTAYDSADVVVAGGVINGASSVSAYWMIKNNTLFLNIKGIDIDTLATVRYVTISLPTSPLMTGKSKRGNSFCRFMRAATGGSGLPCVASIDLSSSGAGDGLRIMKADNSDFGGLSNYDFRFSIAIALI